MKPSKKFKKSSYRHPNTENLILIAVGTWHMGSRWYTPDFS